MAHHDRTSLINHCTQRSIQHQQYLERIFCTGYVLQPTCSTYMYKVFYSSNRKPCYMIFAVVHETPSRSESFRIHIICMYSAVFLREALSIFLQSGTLTANFKSKLIPAFCIQCHVCSNYQTDHNLLRNGIASRLPMGGNPEI